MEILIVEDEPLIAEDISYFLEEAGYKKNIIVHSYTQAITQLETKNFDFIFLDFNLGEDSSGADLAKEVNLNYMIPFAFITSYADKNSIQQIKVLHPVGYIVKPFNGKEIPAVLELGLELFYSYMDTNKELDLNKINKFANSTLTPQEINILAKLIEGKSNKQISDELFVSINTTKTHLKNIFLKLDVSSRSEAMVILAKCQS